MDTQHLPLLMMIVFLLIIFFGRIVFQLVLTGNSGVRSGTKLKTKKSMYISAVLSGVIVVQLLLAWLMATSRLKLQIEFGSAVIWIGIILCIAGILFSSFSQFAMGQEWRIGVDPDEKTKLVTTGIYNHIRNPIYTGCIAVSYTHLTLPTILLV